MVAVYGTDQQEGWARQGHMDLTATGAADYLQTVSGGRLQTTGTAASHVVDGRSTPWFRIPMNLSTACGAGALNLTRGPALDALGASGIDPARYERIAVYSLQSPTCTWGGGMWGFNAQTGVLSTLNVFTTIHELGHSLTLTHLHGRNCTTSVFAGSDCVYEEYGGRFDPMGQTWPNPIGYSALSLEKLGWLRPDEVTRVAGNGTYRVNSLYAAGSVGTTRALRLDNPRGSSLNLEYRPADGPDADLGTAQMPDTTPGVVVYDRPSWSQLDATPGSQANDLADGSLRPGNVVVTPQGVRLEVVAMTPDHADVRVDGW